MNASVFDRDRGSEWPSAKRASRCLRPRLAKPSTLACLGTLAWLAGGAAAIGQEEEEVEPTPAAIRFHQGKSLSPLSVRPNGEEPVPHPERESEGLAEQYRPLLGERIELSAGEQLRLEIEVSESGWVFLKLHSATSSLRGLSAQLSQEGRELESWTHEQVPRRRDFVEGMKAMVEVDETHLAVGSEWVLELSNRTEASIALDVWIGLAPRKGEGSEAPP